MSTSRQDWFKWNDQLPQPNSHVMLRGESYKGAAHFVEDRLRAWNPSRGYGADLAIDPFAEWHPLVVGSLPSVFAVD